MDTMAVDIFLSERPHYSREHVTNIQQAMTKAGIPFCFTCADWHHIGEEHSSDL